MNVIAVVVVAALVIWNDTVDDQRSFLGARRCETVPESIKTTVSFPITSAATVTGTLTTTT